jgi:hypothetical protein
MAILSNVKCRWASVQEPRGNPKYPQYGESWEIQAELSPAQVVHFTEQGVGDKITKDDKGISLLRFKRKTKGMSKKGVPFDKQAPRVVDAHKQPFTGLIGNGSVVNINYSITKYGMGVGIDLAAVQVVNLVPYEPKDTSNPVDEFSVVDSAPVEDINPEEVPF